MFFFSYILWVGFIFLIGRSWNWNWNFRVGAGTVPPAGKNGESQVLGFVSSRSWIWYLKRRRFKVWINPTSLHHLVFLRNFLFDEVKFYFSVYKSATAAPQASQMTIFYAGQVFVFNNFPEERVGEVMFLAGRESSKLNIPAATVASGQPILVGTPADALSSSSPVSTRTPTPPPPPQPQSVTGGNYLPQQKKKTPFWNPLTFRRRKLKFPFLFLMI